MCCERQLEGPGLVAIIVLFCALEALIIHTCASPDGRSCLGSAATHKEKCVCVLAQMKKQNHR